MVSYFDALSKTQLTDKENQTGNSRPSEHESNSEIPHYQARVLNYKTTSNHKSKFLWIIYRQHGISHVLSNLEFLVTLPLIKAQQSTKNQQALRRIMLPSSFQEGKISQARKQDEAGSKQRHQRREKHLVKTSTRTSNPSSS